MVINFKVTEELENFSVMQLIEICNLDLKVSCLSTKFDEVELPYAEKELMMRKKLVHRVNCHIIEL